MPLMNTGREQSISKLNNHGHMEEGTLVSKEDLTGEVFFKKLINLIQYINKLKKNISCQ